MRTTSFLFEDKLIVIQFRVETAEFEQLVMISTFNDLSIFEDNNLIGIEDGLETMGNDKTGSTCYYCLHSMLDFAFCYGINIGSRFI